MTTEKVKRASVTCGTMPKSQTFMSKNQNKMKNAGKSIFLIWKFYNLQVS